MGKVLMSKNEKQGMMVLRVERASGQRLYMDGI